MIRLHQFYPVWSLTTASSFCLKLETYLRMVGLAYEVVVEEDPRKAPLGKLPYVEDDGQTLVDSGLIIDYLKAKYGDPLDGELSDAQRAQSLVLQRTIEESLYWSLMYFRWIDPEGWRHQESAYFGFLPWPLRVLVPKIVRASVRKELNGHGRGRLHPDDIYRLGGDDLAALSVQLGDKPYLLGDTSSSIDAALYGVLAHILFPPFDSPLKNKVLSLGNLGPYAERIRQSYYP